METKLFKHSHFQQTISHIMYTNHISPLPKRQLQFSFLLLSQLLQLDDISTFIHSTRHSLHILISLCLSSPSSIPTKPLLRHLQRSLHDSLLIDPLRVPIHIALLFGPRSREITLRSLMNPQHSLRYIDENAVRITSYYGHGYNYYSMANNQKWDAETLAVNKENGYLSYENTGGSATNNSYWNATVVVTADGFEAENIIFENSFNQYISKKESEDVVVEWEVGGKGTRPTEAGSTEVQNKSFVERAAALALVGSDKVVLNNCRVVGRQDSFYGGDGVRAAIYKGVMMGGTDYLFGEMTAVFYRSQLAMNTSEDKNDVSYITAAKQSSGRGYLMYECTVTSAVPGTETASAYRSKPGYFGRPWQANTAETVFYNTTIETSDNPGYAGQSLIEEVGWNNTLSGSSALCCEYGTIEQSGTDNSGKRAAWATVLTEPKLADGTEITTLNFTKGTDGWDPFPALIANDPAASICMPDANEGSWTAFADGHQLHIQGIDGRTRIAVYGMDGQIAQNLEADSDVSLPLQKGIWIVRISDNQGTRTVKVAAR